MYVLDSSALIELINDTRRADQVASILSDEPLAITTISMHEILLSTNQLERFKIEGICTGITILSHDEHSARAGARMEIDLIREGKRINRPDIFIAAICKINRAHLITFDRDFSKIKDLQVTVL